MEKQPEFLLLPLQEIIIRKIVVDFWNEADVLALMEKIQFRKSFCSRPKLWKKTVEKKVDDKISALNTLEKLKIPMRLIVIPIGLQIIEWKNFMEQCLCDLEETLDMNLLKHLCWTSAGTVHYERTAEKLARFPTLDVVKRYKIASEHCLVDSLPGVWKELPEIFKREFLELLSHLDSINFFKCKCPLPTYWAYVLQGEECRLLGKYNNFYRHALKFSAERGNKAATKYFFQKISNEQKGYFYRELGVMLDVFFKDRIMYDFPHDKLTDAFCYLLSQISPEKQIQALKNYPGTLFETFLTWRWHDLFLDKADLLWKFLPERQTYHNILNHMTWKVHFSEHYFPEIFQECIRQSPREFGTHLLKEERMIFNQFSLFNQLLLKDDIETFKVIFRHIDVEDKVGYVFSLEFFLGFGGYLEGKRHHLLEFCIRDACRSKEDREELKEAYIKFFTKYGQLEGNFTKWQKFFESLEKTDASIPKKRCADVTETRDKKLLCNTEEKKKLKTSVPCIPTTAYSPWTTFFECMPVNKEGN